MGEGYWCGYVIYGFEVDVFLVWIVCGVVGMDFVVNFYDFDYFFIDIGMIEECFVVDFYGLYVVVGLVVVNIVLFFVGVVFGFLLFLGLFVGFGFD